MGTAGRAPGVSRAHFGLGPRAGAPDKLHVLARLDLADRPVSAALAVPLVWHFRPADVLEPRLYRPPAGGAGDSRALKKGRLLFVNKKKQKNFINLGHGL